MFLFEILFSTCIILIAILLFKLKSFKLNADSILKQFLDLQGRLTADKNTYENREQKLHQTITGLREVLSEEQQIIKTKELDLKSQEAGLLKNIAEVQKNLDEETENRKKVVSQKKSSEVRLGLISETLAPFLDQFDFDPENCIFLGKPIDYISFEDEIITFIEVKSGQAQLSTKQRHIRDLVKDKQIAWKQIRIK
jgi:predicted Holliday junction resolvase-like endonuclease|tara:strand:- start:5800 stop:6387 length:588 start_codon:yes stop_codon:yes gene_type:complete